MRLLIATPLYPPDDGGPATYAKLLETALPAKGITVSVVSFSNYRHLQKGVSHLSYTWALFCAAKNADIILTLDPVSVGLPALIVSYLRRKPLVLKMVGDYAWEQGTQRFGVKESLDEFVKRDDYPSAVRTLRAVERQVAERALRVIVPSEYLKSIVKAWGIPSEKITVVYNAFNADLPTASKEVLRKKFNYGHPVIISVGRMVPWKGFKGLMDAAAPLVEEYPGLSLEIVGSGDRGEYESYAKEKGYEFVHFSPNQSHEEILSRIKAADCFALNTGYEGLSHLLLEAMAVETPIVTTHVGGNTELLTGERGVLLPYNDNDALTKALRDTLTDKKKAQEMASRAGEYVQGFTEPHMLESLVSLLNTVKI
jgi:glycosyltransferase involved in cell wall biosynthesis